MEKKAIISTFERVIKGKNRKFWVQLIPDEQKEKTIDYFRKYFVRDEPMCKSLKLIEDEESMEFLTECFWNAAKENMSLACFVELDDGQQELVAANLCYQVSVGKKMFEDDNIVPDKCKSFVGVLEYINALKNVKEELSVTKYLSSIGLVTIPEYRGLNIGLEVLKSRKQLCEKLGLPATITQFTAPQSQRLAEKAGFKDLVSMTYDDIEKINPSLKFPDINNYSRCIRYMYIKY